MRLILHIFIALNFGLWSVVALAHNAAQPQPGRLEKIDSVNGLQSYSGVIFHRGEVLNGIRWIDHAGMMTEGKFRFPVDKGKNYELYTPWKEGYSFYPEVVKFDENNTHQVFSAIRLSLNDELVYQFNFEKGVRNEVDRQLSEHELFHVGFTKEKERGKVLSFDSAGAAVQFKRNPEFDTSKPFTISAWVNPDTVREIHTLVSKGLVFSFKIRHGGLSFAGTGFNSVISDSVMVESGKWQHISCVYVPGYHVQFFLNGKLVHDEAFDSLRVNEQALTIGNNYSSEGFSGKMDDLRLWNRALSCEEIAQVYNQPGGFKSFTVVWLLLPVLPVVGLAYFTFRRKRKFRNANPNKEAGLQQITGTELNRSMVCLFGDLYIPGTPGENLAHQLTPRLKQLFVLLILHPRGLSISRINNDLWPGVDEEKAKQSRNYAIQQLKKVLSGNPAFRLEYLSKNWILQFDASIQADVHQLDELEEKLKIQPSDLLIDAYLSIVERGPFLPGIDNECFDGVKAQVSERISSHFPVWTAGATPKTALRMGNVMLLQDSLSEDGLRISVRALTASGRNGEAVKVFQNFAKRYKNTYNEEFSVPFQSLF